MAYSEPLAERVAEILREKGDVEEKKMFGGLAFMVSGYMCVGIIDDKLMVRLGEDGAQNALEETHVHPMDFTGKPMKGYIFVEPHGIGTEKALRRWVNAAQNFISTLPPR